MICRGCHGAVTRGGPDTLPHASGRNAALGLSAGPETAE